ncbi:hypothetical protein AB833_24885 [Chromatiales bacterium (ex Bugula neritina AB1)]|nr:hypothetical protein AB833_24885 [Chromatiales bacterium (ex Bugula neritina AB1)]
MVLGSGMRSSPLHNEPVNHRLFVVRDPWVFSNPVGDKNDPATGLPVPQYPYVDLGNDRRSIIQPDNLWRVGSRIALTGQHHGFYKVLAQAGEKILQ